MILRYWDLKNETETKLVQYILETNQVSSRAITSPTPNTLAFKEVPDMVPTDAHEHTEWPRCWENGVPTNGASVVPCSQHRPLCELMGVRRRGVTVVWNFPSPYRTKSYIMCNKVNDKHEWFPAHRNNKSIHRNLRRKLLKFGSLTSLRHGSYVKYISVPNFL